jgi:hypothetical protein
MRPQRLLGSPWRYQGLAVAVLVATSHLFYSGYGCGYDDPTGSKQVEDTSGDNGYWDGSGSGGSGTGGAEDDDSSGGSGGSGGATVTVDEECGATQADDYPTYFATPMFRSVAIDGDRAYLVDGTNLWVVDRDETAPTDGLTATPGFTTRSVTPLAGHPIDLTLHDGLLYIAAVDGGVIVVDPGDGLAPLVLYTLRESDRAMAVAARGNRLYVAAGTDGIQSYLLRNGPPRFEFNTGAAGFATGLAMSSIGILSANCSTVGLLEFSTNRFAEATVSNIERTLNFDGSVRRTGTRLRNIKDIATDGTIAILAAADSGIGAIRLADLTAVRGGGSAARAGDFISLLTYDEFDARFYPNQSAILEDVAHVAAGDQSVASFELDLFTLPTVRLNPLPPPTPERVTRDPIGIEIDGQDVLALGNFRWMGRRTLFRFAAKGTSLADKPHYEQPNRLVDVIADETADIPVVGPDTATLSLEIPATAAPWARNLSLFSTDLVWSSSLVTQPCVGNVCTALFRAENRALRFNIDPRSDSASWSHYFAPVLSNERPVVWYHEVSWDQSYHFVRRVQLGADGIVSDEPIRALKPITAVIDAPNREWVVGYDGLLTRALDLTGRPLAGKQAEFEPRAEFGCAIDTVARPDGTDRFFDRSVFAADAKGFYAVCGGRFRKQSTVLFVDANSSATRTIIIPSHDYVAAAARDGVLYLAYGDNGTFESGVLGLTLDTASGILKSTSTLYNGPGNVVAGDFNNGRFVLADASNGVRRVTLPGWQQTTVGAPSAAHTSTGRAAYTSLGTGMSSKVIRSVPVTGARWRALEQAATMSAMRRLPGRKIVKAIDAVGD